MRFLVDENLSTFLVKSMRTEGWDVEWIVEIAAGVDDNTVIQIAKNSSRVLLTSDVELASRTLWEEQHSVPTLLLRLEDMDHKKAAVLVIETLKQRTDWPLLHSVLTPSKLRTRPKLKLFK